MKITEAVAQRCSVKNVLLKMSQNLQENTCTRPLACNFVKKETRRFPQNFAKLLRTPSFMEHLRWLSPKIKNAFSFFSVCLDINSSVFFTCQKQLSEVFCEKLLTACNFLNLLKKRDYKYTFFTEHLRVTASHASIVSVKMLDIAQNSIVFPSVSVIKLC